MVKILILFAHPVLEKSRVQSAMHRRVQEMPGITVNDLYQCYPDFDIDVDHEQELLLAHDVIVMQHPFYWYSAPAILKQWMDLVLQHGWAYGASGDQLQGKIIFNAISTGGRQEAYRQDGYNRYTMEDFLRPFEQTARLCKMRYWPPFVVHGVHRMEPADIQLHAVQYEELLIALQHDRISAEEIQGVRYLNELTPISKTIVS